MIVTRENELHVQRLGVVINCRGAETASPAVMLQAIGSRSSCRVNGPQHEWCVYKRIEPDGRISAERSIDVSVPQMIHDFAITENYAIFLDGAIVFDPKAMVREKLPFVTDRNKTCRIGLLRRSEPEAGIFQWFSVGTFVCFHTMNAWEEDDGRVCLCICWCAADVFSTLCVSAWTEFL
jgi:carotenoid cleavage dioxygenase-like enzyme